VFYGKENSLRILSIASMANPQKKPNFRGQYLDENSLGILIWKGHLMMMLKLTRKTLQMGVRNSFSRPSADVIEFL